jgi:two-component system chemotaxis response regulator CheB
MPRADAEMSAFHTTSCPTFPHTAFDVVVVGASLGGRAVLEALLAPLPADFPAPILVAQHIDERMRSHLPELLARHSRMPVRHATAGERLQAGTVYVAPPGRHLLVADDARCALSDGPRVSFARPAVDLLFASAAEQFGARTLGLVLTGRLFDGAAGAAAIHAAGGVVIAQDPSSCRAAEMPRAAIRRGATRFTLPPSTLAAALVSLVAVPGATVLFGLGARAA